MKISKAHQKFAELLGNLGVLEHPEDFLGPNWKNIMNFWFYLDTLSDEQKKIVNERFYGMYSADRSAAENAARDVTYYAAQDVTKSAAYFGLWTRAAAWNAVYEVSSTQDVDLFAVGWATYELIGSHILQEQNKPLTFLPMFFDL